MEYFEEQDGSIRVEYYRTGVHRDVVLGHLRQGGEDEDYWHFYPATDCVLNAGNCKRLAQKISELNGRA